MTRQAFLARLREGLRGLPPQAVADIMADYEAHFADGEAAGRTEAEVSAIVEMSEQMVRHYAQAVDKRRLAIAAMKKLEAAWGGVRGPRGT